VKIFHERVVMMPNPTGVDREQLFQQLFPAKKNSISVRFEILVYFKYFKGN
jgi:hypothetical protein